MTAAVIVKNMCASIWNCVRLLWIACVYPVVKTESVSKNYLDGWVSVFWIKRSPFSCQPYEWRVASRASRELVWPCIIWYDVYLVLQNDAQLYSICHGYDTCLKLGCVYHKRVHIRLLHLLGHLLKLIELWGIAFVTGCDFRRLLVPTRAFYTSFAIKLYSHTIRWQAEEQFLVMTTLKVYGVSTKCIWSCVLKQLHEIYS